MKRLLVLILVAASFLTVLPETVSQKQALQYAQLFFNEATGRVTAPPKLIYNGRKLTTNRLFTPFYVYNTPLGGFVIISAENKAYPILGYSLKESFDIDKIGGSELSLLKSYAREIEMIRYDSQPIESTISAWTDYADYVDGILKAKYEATDPKLTINESAVLIEQALNNDDAAYADLYTPSQWQEMIDEELSRKEVVALGIVENQHINPFVIYGRKGDYYRIEMSSRNEWLMRLNATEIISGNMVAALVPPSMIIPEDEETPFALHDEFLEEVWAIETARMEKLSPDRMLVNSAPSIRSSGGGRFEILLPENAVMARIYNLSGNEVRKFSYSDTQIANIDISAEPFGFYIVNVIGESGTPYGFKLYR